LIINYSGCHIFHTCRCLWPLSSCAVTAFTLFFPGHAHPFPPLTPQGLQLLAS
jgi:hypothetical protein